MAGGIYYFKEFQYLYLLIKSLKFSESWNLNCKSEQFKVKMLPFHCGGNTGWGIRQDWTHFRRRLNFQLITQIFFLKENRLITPKNWHFPKMLVGVCVKMNKIYTYCIALYNSIREFQIKNFVTSAKYKSIISKMI